MKLASFLIAGCIGLAATLTALPSALLAQPQCAVDLNGSGAADDPGEVMTCEPAHVPPRKNDGEDESEEPAPEPENNAWLCSYGQVACAANSEGNYVCPLGGGQGCLVPAGGGTPLCSPSACAVIADSPVLDDPGAPADGLVDAAGNCLGAVEIFAGRALRCRPPGLRTTFSNCCSDKGKIVKDGMGSSLASLQTKIAVAKGVFTGMKAAYLAFKAGASAGQAASAGAHAIIVGIDPTSIAINLAINFMFEFLLSGCDQQDMEVGMLRGSGMCHEVGTYCSSSILGICIQKSRGHCCFNTKLGRIIQEQGRPQLKSFNGIGWGTPKSPYCRGFTPEEFQALDFSRMDFSEYYSEIEARAQADIQIHMKDKIDGYMRNLVP